MLAGPRIGMSLGICAALCVAYSAQAQTAAQWSFNSPVSDLNIATGTLLPSIPTNPTGVLFLGGVTNDFQSGDSENGSTDPNTGDDSALELLNFPPQGTASGTAGVQFNVSTVGFQNIVVTFDARHSSTSPNTLQLLYSTDGVNFITATTFTATAGGETWNNSRSFNFTTIPAANNNANFKIRIVAVFDPLTGNTSYTGAGGVYAPTGAIRLDMVTVTGSPTAPIPPSGVLTITPPAVCSSGGQITLRVPVNRGINPNSSGLAVRANLASLGGSATQSLFDNGTNGDVTPNDRIYTLAYAVPPGQTPGPRTIPITITDSQGRSATSSASVTVGDCGQNSTSRVVISQIYGGGGNSTTPASALNADYIELFNRSAAPVDMTGWSVQFAYPLDPIGFGDPKLLCVLSGTIQPGQYFLIECTIPNLLGAPLITPDLRVNELIGIGRTSGKVALVRSAALLGAACSSPDLEDFVGYGLASECFEGAGPTGIPNNDSAVVRKLSGAQDSDQNFNDFVVTIPTPHNRASGGFLAGYASLSSPGVCAGSDITLSVAVSPAASPVSSGISVTANLSALGGSSAQSLTDLGSGTYAFTYPVPGATLAGSFEIPIRVSDAQGRVDTSKLNLVVARCTNSPSAVVINRLYSGGGNPGAIFNADFVELFNRSAASVDLTGWSLQYASAINPAGFDGLHQLALAGSLLPGQYMLIQASSASLTVGTPIPTPDLISPTSLAFDNEFGRVALVRSTLPIGTACTSASVEDLVSYGERTLCFEGVAPVSKLANHLVVRRRQGGCQDNNQNLVDLEVGSFTEAPKTLLSTPSPCAVTVIVGACCVGSSCSVVQQPTCLGSFQGAGTTCDFPANPVTCCPANFNLAGGVTVQDIFDFLTAWFSNSPAADINHQGGVTVQDIFDYLSLWFLGC